ncbi:MAG: hypothetical protein Q4G48_00825 [Bacteroidia bacterium]|nr:hypothetical protein [Bacteroidia bacterium]
MNMRKLILLFIAVSFGLTMTSCLDGNQNFSESDIVYIDQQGSAIYGKTLSNRRLITSNQMILMDPGTFKFFHYSWEEENGYTQIGDVNVNNVVIQGDPVDIAKTYLQTNPVMEVEDPARFNEIREPIRDPEGVYFGDLWLFEYSYMGKEGETPVVTFNKRNSDEQYPDNVEIDIRLAKTGTPKEGAAERQMGDLISVDMRALRQMYAGQNKDVNIKFFYYVKDKEELNESRTTYLMRMKSSAQ